MELLLRQVVVLHVELLVTRLRPDPSEHLRVLLEVLQVGIEDDGGMVVESELEARRLLDRVGADGAEGIQRVLHALRHVPQVEAELVGQQVTTPIEEGWNRKIADLNMSF